MTRKLSTTVGIALLVFLLPTASGLAQQKRNTLELSQTNPVPKLGEGFFTVEPVEPPPTSTPPPAATSPPPVPWIRSQRTWWYDMNNKQLGKPSN